MADDIIPPMQNMSIGDEPETGGPLGDDPASSVSAPPPPAESGMPTTSTNLPSSATTQSSGDESKAGKFISLVNDMAGKLVQLMLNHNPTSRYQSNNVSFIYNPLEYAKETHDCFVRKYGNSTKSVLFLGMNPGPNDTAQNGVPFGETNYVKDWLKITGNVGKPPEEHDNHTIDGLGYTGRKSISGERFWELCKNQCGTPENFFKECFVYDYCPLMFLDSGGANITPPEILPADVRNRLIEVCDGYLFRMIKLLEVKVVVGMGRFAEDRSKKVIQSNYMEGVEVVYIQHPSPKVPENWEWQNSVEEILNDNNLMKYMK